MSSLIEALRDASLDIREYMGELSVYSSHASNLRNSALVNHSVCKVVCYPTILADGRGKVHNQSLHCISARCQALCYFLTPLVDSKVNCQIKWRFIVMILTV